MQRTAWSLRTIGVPVALVGLAVVMPVEGVSPASSAQQWTERAACQAESLGGQVTQAARDLCGGGSLAAVFAAVALPEPPASSHVAPPAPPDRAPALGRLDPHRIDLPPPA